jgi:hypothetical protein
MYINVDTGQACLVPKSTVYKEIFHKMNEEGLPYALHISETAESVPITYLQDEDI